jgi:hypothetical protein
MKAKGKAKGTANESKEDSLYNVISIKFCQTSEPENGYACRTLTRQDDGSLDP